jgi:hypothetical protein
LVVISPAKVHTKTQEITHRSVASRGLYRARVIASRLGIVRIGAGSFRACPITSGNPAAKPLIDPRARGSKGDGSLEVALWPIPDLPAQLSDVCCRG